VTHQNAASYAPGLADAGGQVARLCQVLALVEEIAGRPASAPTDAWLDEAARISATYDAAWPIDQRRFDCLAGETALRAAAGVEALLALRERQRPSAAAAARLAEELGDALKRLSNLLA
jgi:hypothetical protein